MLLTFFCKRDRHSDCPGEWPVGESCNSDHDCSFDIRMTKCECDCHRKVRDNDLIRIAEVSSNEPRIFKILVP